jgi:hypothetical protein
MLTHGQMQTAITAAKQRFALIRGKYPELKGYLVVSSPNGQTGIDSSPAQILEEFPTMVIADDAKASLLNFPSRQAESKIEAGTQQKLKELASRLNYDEKCQVEIRFNGLNYDLIWKLQMDDLIDRSLTPQTKASIRIVLGTLAHFAGIQSKEPT